MRCLFLISLLFLSSVSFAQKPAQDDDSEEPKQSVKGFQFKLKERPSFRYGDILRMDVKSKWHIDFRHFDPEVNTTKESGDLVSVTRARFGLKGEVTKYFEYEVEREMRGAIEPDHPYHPWKDVYVDFQPYGFVRFKVGKFKVPFGMEENTSEDRLDFVYRSQVTDYLAPGRERGAMLHGKFLESAKLEYEAGFFRFDGENSDIKGIPSAGHTYAFRLTGEPLRYVPKFLPKSIRHTYLGVAATTGDLFEGLNSLHGQTITNLTYFDHVYVKGRRLRTGVELAWSEGPFSVKGEYIHVAEQRKEQGIRGNDIPDKISRGWYATGSWVALGKLNSKGDEPKKPFRPGHGYGALGLAARFDVLTFYSDTNTGIPSPSPRAANLAVNSDRTWTFGTTWYLNHWVKIQANGEREWITAPSRRDFDKEGLSQRNAFWTAVVRLQFAM